MFEPKFQITPSITKDLMAIEAARQAIIELPLDVKVLQGLHETAKLLTTHYSTQISPFVSGIPARVQALHRAGTAWFESVARGEINLPASSPPASRTAEDDAARFSGDLRKFTGDELDGL